MEETVSETGLSHGRIVLGGGGGFLFQVVSGSGSTRRALGVNPPIFEIDGISQTVASGFTPVEEGATAVSQGDAGDVTEWRAVLPLGETPHQRLEIVFQTSIKSPVARFRFVLHSDTVSRLTKSGGTDDALTYLRLRFMECDAGMERVKEVRFSEFDSFLHSFRLSEHPLETRHFENRLRIIGPMLTASSDRKEGDSPGVSALVAYEHGSQIPDAFLAYDLDPNGSVSLRAVKGNYCDGQMVGPGQPFVTTWFQIAVVEGDEDDLARTYREWVLKYQSRNTASRRPYIFYNTWNYQERNKHWNKNAYLDAMNEERMLAEIDIAHRMGIDVFVIDTGWYEKTGDWRVSAARFPNGLATIKAKLDGYGMQLGLWFNPTVAALSSEMHIRHRDCLMTRSGEPHAPHEVWETEASQGLCLVSRYGDAFARELIRLNREVGVTYFKWDAIGQYGCDAPGHGHGTTENTPEERRQAYGFLLGRAMTDVVDTVCAACPDAIVDFDITEGGRTVGLQFLSAGKYFLINNGPYSHDYQMQTPADGNVNLFFYPGPARAWVCRSPLDYDKWLPSVLFLTHYLPDDTHRDGWGVGREVQAENQWIAIASLVLGQNGIWGDLLAVSDEGIARFGEALGWYKQVRDDITLADPFRTGHIGGSPEVHEKIDRETGRGVVSFFAAAPGTYSYVTKNIVANGIRHNDGVTVTADPHGRARITATFAPGQYAKVIFFGIS
jgi:alpha-galactosidase